MIPIRVIAAVTFVLSISQALAADAEPLQWYRCNTHTHTSAPGPGANESPAFVAQWYRSHGYQCLVITDHEFHTDVAPLNLQYGSDGRFLVLRGQEISQMVADPTHQPGGVRHLHVNGINTDRVIMPIGPKDASNKTGLLKLAADSVSVTQAYQRNLAEVAKAGGLAQINHPNLLWSADIDDLLPLDTPYMLEIWNAFPTSNNLGSKDKASTEAIWDALLTKGKTVWGVASDDSHEYHTFDNRESPTPGKGWIVLQAPALTVPAVTEAMRAGRFYASTGVSLVRYSVDKVGISIQIEQSVEWAPKLPPSAEYTTRFIGANGKVLAEVGGLTPQYRFNGTEQYIRAVIVDSDGRKAWTQPAFSNARR